MSELFAVVVVCEREIDSIHICESHQKAVNTANELLESHINDIDCVGEYEDGDGEDDKWHKASKNSDNAWCNWHSMNWDAYIIVLEPANDLQSFKGTDEVKNARPEMLKKCIFIPGDEYVRLVTSLTDGKVAVEFCCDGIAYCEPDGVEWGDAYYGAEEINAMLSEHFGVTVTSVHMDDCDYVGVWVCYTKPDRNGTATPMGAASVASAVCPNCGKPLVSPTLS